MWAVIINNDTGMVVECKFWSRPPWPVARNTAKWNEMAYKRAHAWADEQLAVAIKWES